MTSSSSVQQDPDRSGARRYRLVWLNADGSFAVAFKVNAETDERAIANAWLMVGEHDAELWDGFRLVKRLPATDIRGRAYWSICDRVLRREP